MVKKHIRAFSVVFIFLLSVFGFGQSPCVNTGFESSALGLHTASNSVPGWTLESATNSNSTGVCQSTSLTAWNNTASEFWIVSTPISGHPFIGTIPHSPLGGAKVAQLNNTTTSNVKTRIRTTFPVTSLNSLFQYAYCGSWDGSSHSCCDQPFFMINVYDCLGNLDSWCSFTLTPAGQSCPSGVTGFSVTGGTTWTNWKTNSIDLSWYINSCVTIEVVSSDCILGGHHGSLYFDAACGAQYVPINLSPTGQGGPVNYCIGSNLASITAPLGYAAYNWVGPSNAPPLTSSQASSSVLQIPNPISGTTYTLYLVSASQYVFVKTITLNPTSIVISGLGTSPTCVFGANGSATVAGNGSGTGYNYSWINSSNAVVSTTSIAPNLVPGNYTVFVSAIGSPSCGIATAVFSITTGQSITEQNKLFCGTQAFLTGPPGTNYKWYHGNTAIPANNGGTASSYTATQVLNGDHYWLGVTNTFGCRDSIKYNLIAATPGSLALSFLKEGCLNSNNAIALLTFTPSSGSGGLNTFSVLSTGSTSPYQSGLFSSTLSSITASNLATNGTYVAQIFDGNCSYSQTFTVPLSPYPILYTGGNTQICSGQSTYLSIGGANTATWSTSQHTTIINVSPSVTTTYTVSGTDNLSGCTKSTAITVTVTPSPTVNISGFLNVCQGKSTALFASGAHQYNWSSGQNTQSISVSPASTTLYSVIGTSTVTGCSMTNSVLVTVLQSPNLNITGDLDMCAGETTTLFATGTPSYTWSTGAGTSSITITANTNTLVHLYGATPGPCYDTSSVMIIVYPKPNLVITGDTLICEGYPANLSVTGADNYLWTYNYTSPTIQLYPYVSTYYSVVGTNTLGGCKATANILVEVQTCTSLAENIIGTDLRIFPNPATTQVFIESNSSGILLLTDLSGRKLFEQIIKEGNQQIDLSQFPEGTYFLIFNTGSQQKTSTLVIRR